MTQTRKQFTEGREPLQGPLESPRRSRKHNYHNSFGVPFGKYDLPRTGYGLVWYHSPSSNLTMV